MQFVSDREALATYRYLRIAMPALIVLLIAAVASQIFAPEPDCWLGSISAYYYTSARAVFVATLCALGVCLIIYQGSTRLEDFALNISGFLAFVVALVPTPLADLVVKPTDLGGADKEPICKRSNVPSSSQLVDAFNNNVWALLIAATVVLIVVLWFRAKAGSGELSVALCVLIVSLVASWATFVLNRDFVRDYGHLIAATTMFAGIVLVVTINASIPWNHIVPKALYAVIPWKEIFQEAETPPQPYLRWYRLILVAMVSAVLIIGGTALWADFDHAIFWLEAALIGLFGGFWVVQTIELWNFAARGRGPQPG